MTDGSPYEFVIQDDAQAWHRLDFHPYDAAAKPWFSSVWQRITAALAAAHRQADSTAPDWVQWKPWDWCEQKRPGYESRQTIVAWCGPQVAGFLNVWRGVPSQFDPGQQTLYIIGLLEDYRHE